MSEGKIQIIRKTFTDETSIGDLLLDDKFICYTLEDKDRGLFQGLPIDKILSTKIYGKTAIPYGKYNVELIWMPRLKCICPHIKDIPGFEGVFIHWGNYAKDTLGCPLTGNSKAPDFVGYSKDAFAKLMGELKKLEKISIEIKKA